MKSNRDFTSKEKKWLATFERVMKNAPDSLFLFVGEGFYVFVTDENKYPIYNKSDGGIDSSVTSISVSTNIKYDGGAF